MRFRDESRRDAYDAIVVGSGIGGLTTAALLARAGRSVLVVERHDRVGGYAHSFRRGRYLFDSAVHLVGGCEPVDFEGGGLIHSLLTTLGVRDRCDFARIDPCYAAVVPRFGRASAVLDRRIRPGPQRGGSHESQGAPPAPPGVPRHPRGDETRFAAAQSVWRDHGCAALSHPAALSPRHPRAGAG